MTSSIPPSADPAAAAPSDRLWLRSELMGTQVITRDTGRRLGVVGEVVVDIDRREVVALGLRDNPLTRFLPGLPRWMPLDRIRQVGDVILVDSADSLAQGFNPERYSKVINCQVISESGEQLGRVLGFSFDIETGELTTLVLGALGVPLLGEGVLSTWELAVEEVVSSGPDRIIVYEGAEEKLKQLGTGLLEKLGIGGPSWEQEERDRFRQTMVPVENQLASGQPSVQEQRRIQPATSRAVEPSVDQELEYVELERRRQEPLRQRRYLDDEDEETYGREPRRYGRDGERNFTSDEDRGFSRGEVRGDGIDDGPGLGRPSDRGYGNDGPGREAFEPLAPQPEPPLRELTQRELPLRERPPLQARPDSRRRPLMGQDPVDVDVEPYTDGEMADEPAPRRRTDYEDPW
ncbi:PRC-barrel domain-containing protein [Synechococcus sp. ATX 2A4]|uniref:PRC-barrel domain-containing protein n=1 Tax=Synechococcus sp. ATX 2A4 TaxID=2823727 RepID=UPI0037DA78DE|nr:PRC-barrel domain-containing protein [Synechococcus sp. ATX 2A4]